MVEATADVGSQYRIAHGLRPVEQQIVIVEHVLPLFCLHIGREQFLQLGSPSGAPRKCRAQHVFDRGFRVDAARIDRKTGALGRKPLLGFRKSLLVADQIQKVGGILAVMNGKSGIEPDLLGIVAQQPRPDAMKSAGPGQRVRHHAGIVAQNLARDSLDARRHLGGGAARKRHQKNAPWVGAANDQMRHAMGKRIGLAGSCAGDHQQRRKRARARRAMLDGAPLFRIEAFEIGGCRWHQTIVLE